MHVHSTASELSKLGIQRSLHLPECATEPAEAFELARRQDRRLHLVLAGGGPEEPALRERLGDAATFLG